MTPPPKSEILSSSPRVQGIKTQLDVAVCACNSRTGETQTSEVLGRSGQPA